MVPYETSASRHDSLRLNPRRRNGRNFSSTSDWTRGFLPAFSFLRISQQSRQWTERLSAGLNVIPQRLQFFSPFLFLTTTFAGLRVRGGFGLFFSSWIFSLILFASSTSGSFESSSSYFWRISSVSFSRISSGGSVFWISGVVQEREISSCDGGVSFFFSWTCSWIFFASASVTFLMFAM